MTCLTVSLGVRRSADLDGLRIPHRPLDERLDLGRNGGGEQGGVAVARAAVENAPHIRQKPHVEHAVGFVQHHELDVVELAGAALHVVEQPAGRRHQHIHAVAQGVHLLAVADAAEDHGAAQVGEAGEIVNGGLDLGGQFARRLQDEQTGLRAVLAESGQDRQRERRGLAGAGLRAADHVLPCEDQRNGAKLNGRGLDIAHGPHAFEHRVGQAEFGKWHK